jgi:methyl-accepting chemotaxis protein
MPVWVEVFIAVAAVAIVIQTVMLVSTLVLLRPVIENFQRMASDLQAKINPILSTTSRILDDSEGRIRSIMGDASEITQLARGEAQKVDRVVTDALERIRLQVIHADQIVTGTLEVIEETGDKVRRSVWGPVNQVSALLKGIKVGMDVIRGRQSRGAGDGVPQDEELFI